MLKGVFLLHSMTTPCPCPGRTTPPTQLLWLKFSARQLAESGDWQEKFQTISEDVSARNVLIHSAH